jgi:Fe2+ or Zn2+ uptake regulation protein
MTPQRVAILEAMHAGGHLSPVMIYERVRETGMTEPTVYRTLEFLAENGIVYPVQDGGHLTYELARGSHHHLVCRSCGAQLQLGAEALQGMVHQLERQTGYRLDADHLTFSGLCPDCQAGKR